MYPILLSLHSYIRYAVLILLVVVIIKSLAGLINKKPYGALDNKLSLFLFIFTHTQLLIGLILYFVSPFVTFGAQTMKDKFTRYWTVEHIFAMLIAIVLITLARTTAKKLHTAQAKHRRLFVFNLIALIIVLVTIWLSGRGIF
jgi:hypothetical protein